MAAKISLYADENVSYSIVKGLRLRGIDIETARDASMLGASDEAQLIYAHQHQKTIFTRDDDFLILHSKGMLHSGIIYAPQQRAVGDIIRSLQLICEILSREEMTNHVEFI